MYLDVIFTLFGYFIIYIALMLILGVDPENEPLSTLLYVIAFIIYAGLGIAILLANSIIFPSNIENNLLERLREFLYLLESQGFYLPIKNNDFAILGP